MQTVDRLGGLPFAWVVLNRTGAQSAVMCGWLVPAVALENRQSRTPTLSQMYQLQGSIPI